MNVQWLLFEVVKDSKPIDTSHTKSVRKGTKLPCRVKKRERGKEGGRERREGERGRERERREGERGRERGIIII